MWVEDFRVGAIITGRAGLLDFATDMNGWSEWTQWRSVKSRGNGELEQSRAREFGSSMWSEKPSEGCQDIWGGEKEGVPGLQWMKHQQWEVMASLQESQQIRGFCLRATGEQWPASLIDYKVSLEGVSFGPGSFFFWRNFFYPNEQHWWLLVLIKLGHENNLRVYVKNTDFKAPSQVHWIRFLGQGTENVYFYPSPPSMYTAGSSS